MIHYFFEPSEETEACLHCVVRASCLAGTVRINEKDFLQLHRFIKACSSKRNIFGNIKHLSIKHFKKGRF